VPLNDDTKKIIGKRELDLMKSDSFLINTSRGGTIDQLALTNALKTHQILGAALDVTDPEPIAHDDPLVSMENVIITPHISSASAATLRNMGIMAADNIIHFFTEGKMLACLNPELMG
jgi:phosphoglycerate dehydrogenase-like enzyme